MKKLMILGGSTNQMPLIKCAKQQGHYVVLCDYAEDNIGKECADVFYCVSTLDKGAVLEVAKEENINGIVTNSEPAMPTCAYVGNQLGLLSNPYESVVALSRKDLFRNFLRENGFNCPQSYDTEDYQEAINKISGFQFPLMVKPVDSSGSRGVSRIRSVEELKLAFDTALGFSKLKRVMIEEYIEKTHDYMIGGDIFVLDGKVAFWGLMNCLRNDAVNEFVPVGKSFPAFISSKQFAVIEKTVNAIMDLLNIGFGAFNMEMIFGENDELYMIEMNPRNGGNRIPEILNIITGVDLIRATIEAPLGVQDLDLSYDPNGKFMSTYILHSEHTGILEAIRYDEKIRENILAINMEKQVGDRVEPFNNAEKLLGIVFLEFASLDEMKHKLENIEELIQVDVEQLG